MGRPDGPGGKAAPLPAEAEGRRAELQRDRSQAVLYVHPQAQIVRLRLPWQEAAPAAKGVFCRLRHVEAGIAVLAAARGADRQAVAQPLLQGQDGGKGGGGQGFQGLAEGGQVRLVRADG